MNIVEVNCKTGEKTSRPMKVEEVAAWQELQDREPPPTRANLEETIVALEARIKALEGRATRS
jgi:hypothetical protein